MIMKCANCYDSVATMLADKLKAIETMSGEIQTLRAKVASADVLVEALETIATESHPELWQVEVAIKALSTYDKLSEE